ncbi:MAG: hypothetical protein ABJA69_11345 [Acidobacteriaceae bacterium]
MKSPVISTGVVASRNEASAEWRDLLSPIKQPVSRLRKAKGFASLEMTALGCSS